MFHWRYLPLLILGQFSSHEKRLTILNAQWAVSEWVRCLCKGRGTLVIDWKAFSGGQKWILEREAYCKKGWESKVILSVPQVRWHMSTLRTDCVWKLGRYEYDSCFSFAENAWKLCVWYVWKLLSDLILFPKAQTRSDTFLFNKLALKLWNVGWDRVLLLRTLHVSYSFSSRTSGLKQ